MANCSNFQKYGNESAKNSEYCAPCREGVRAARDAFIDVTLSAREVTHGKYRDTAEIAQELKGVVRKNDAQLTDPQRETLDLICTKIARILSGNPNEPDHWHDIAGYARLIEKELI